MESRSLFSFVVLGLACAPAAFAQTPYGSIRGRVYDEQNALLPGTTVTATTPDAAGPFTAISDGEGGYRLVVRPPGPYKRPPHLPAFAPRTREPLIVRAGLN